MYNPQTRLIAHGFLSVGVHATRLALHDPNNEDVAIASSREHLALINARLLYPTHPAGQPFPHRL